MPKVICISDTHTKHKKLTIEPCDILLHSGDYSSIGRIHEVENFLDWFSKQPAKHKIFIDGNHDGLSQEYPALFKSILATHPDVTYLDHSMVEVEGLKIWGRSTTPSFYNWYHMADRGSPMMKSTLSIIPNDIDILLTHGPAAGILDLCAHGGRVGCEDLLNELERIKPKYLIFGHIHHSAGQLEVNGIKHVNAAILNDNYEFKNKPIILDI